MGRGGKGVVPQLKSLSRESWLIIQSHWMIDFYFVYTFLPKNFWNQIDIYLTWFNIKYQVTILLRVLGKIYFVVIK